MSRTRSLIPAVLISPWIAAPIEVISVLGTSDAGLSSDFGWGLIFGVFAAVPVAYVGMFAVGIPTYLVLKRFGAVRLWWLMLVGAVVPFSVFWTPSQLRMSLLFEVCGAAVALVAWLLLPTQEATAAVEKAPYAPPDP